MPLSDYLHRFANPPLPAEGKLGAQPDNQLNADRTLSRDLRNVRSPCSSSLRDDDTVVANIGIGDDDLFVGTNSKKRGTAMRRRLEKLLGSRITHVRRNISEAALPRRGDAATRLPEQTNDAASIEAVRELKKRYYTGWLDEPIPTLGGKTPRQAAKRAGSRKKLELLLRQMEHDEERLPPEARFDMKRRRQELGV